MIGECIWFSIWSINTIMLIATFTSFINDEDSDWMCILLPLSAMVTASIATIHLVKIIMKLIMFSSWR